MKSKVLLLHGWGVNHHSMEPIANNLGAENILNPDLPGFGEDNEPTKPWFSSNYALWVQELCEKENFKPDIIIGHSNGGKISLRLIANKMLKPKLLVLVAPSFVKHDISKWKKILVLIAKPFKFLGRFKKFRRLFFKVIGSPDYHKLTSNVMKQTFRNVVSEDLREELYKINVPTLIFWGTKDGFTPYSDAKVLNKGIVGSELITFEGGRHFIHRFHAKEIADKVIEKLKDLNIE